MSSVSIVFELPEDLVERARAAGIDVEAQTAPVIEALEAEIKRREALVYLRSLAERARALPDSEKPAPEEIDAARKAYWADKAKA
jgi:post-segregation antitoxin (ccd killing protein)